MKKNFVIFFISLTITLGGIICTSIVDNRPTQSSPQPERPYNPGSLWDYGNSGWNMHG